MQKKMLLVRTLHVVDLSSVTNKLFFSFFDPASFYTFFHSISLQSGLLLWTQADKQTVLIAVRRNGTALKHAHVSLRNDKSVVMEAVTQCGGALR